jgi:hypothetical protein
MEHINEIDKDDLEEYHKMLEARNKLELSLLAYQKYLEDKYLAGFDLEEGDVYLDEAEGLLYYWT